MKEAKKDVTQVDRWIKRLKNNKRIAILILLALVIIGIGAVAGGLENIADLVKLIRGNSVESKDSISVTVPKGQTFKQAVELLAGDAKAVARFETSCGDDLLAAVVKDGPMRGRTVVDLIKMLKYRLPSPLQGRHFTVTVLMEGGLYEISCKE